MARRWLHSFPASYDASKHDGIWQLDTNEYGIVGEDRDGDDGEEPELPGDDEEPEPGHGADGAYPPAPSGGRRPGRRAAGEHKRLVNRMTSHEAFRWRAVILDEAVAVKNMDGAAWRQVRLVPKDAVNFASATPAQNRVTDWAAYVVMMWLTSRIGEVYQDHMSLTDRELTDPGFSPGYEAGHPDLLTVAGARDDPVVGQLR
jgi:hypothetical protein